MSFLKFLHTQQHRSVQSRSARITYIAASLVAAALLTSAIACTRPPAAAATAAPSASRSVTASAPATATSTVATPDADADEGDAASIYDLPSVWRDQTGAKASLSAFRGGPRLLAMVYTNCHSMCPLTVTAMQRIERETDSTVHFVLVTLDPDRDTPAALAKFALERGLPANRWTLLAGTDDATRELAAALSVRYRKFSPEDLAHSNTIFVLDENGVIVRRQEFGNLDESIAMLRQLSHATH